MSTYHVILASQQNSPTRLAQKLNEADADGFTVIEATVGDFIIMSKPDEPEQTIPGNSEDLDATEDQETQES